MKNEWTLVSDQLPAVGDVIACAERRRDGGMMYWAGTVIELSPPEGIAFVDVRGQTLLQFKASGDTLWIKLPPLPIAPS